MLLLSFSLLSFGHLNAYLSDWVVFSASVFNGIARGDQHVNLKL